MSKPCPGDHKEDERIIKAATDSLNAIRSFEVAMCDAKNLDEESYGIIHNLIHNHTTSLSNIKHMSTGQGRTLIRQAIGGVMKKGE